MPSRPVSDRVPPGEVMYKERFPPAWPPADVLFTDDRWYPATVLPWCRHWRAWAALVRWAGGTEDWLG